MQAKELIKYIIKPGLLKEENVKELQLLVNDFPYFQSAHLLLSLASKKWDASVYQQSLKKTAIVATNRAHLFNLIHKLENTEETGNEVLPPIHEEADPVKEEAGSNNELDILKAAEISVEPSTPEKTELTKEDPGAVLEKEISKQVVTSFVEKEILRTHEAHKETKPKEEPASFGDWLSYLKKNNGQSYPQIEEQVNREKLKQQELKALELNQEENPLAGEALSRKKKNQALIDKIIQKNPGLIRTREEQKFFTPESKAKESLLSNEHLVTETLARIYALQGSVNKAIRAYEILSLKFPQKSAYFATLIEKLKTNQ